MDGTALSAKKQINKTKPKLFSATKICNSLPISLHNPLPCYEYALVISGTGQLITENEMYGFSAGDLIVGNKNLRRGVFFDAEGEIISLAVSFKTEQPFVEGNIAVLKADKHFETIKSLFDIIIRESKRKTFVAKHLNENLIKSIMLCMLRLQVPEEAYSHKNKVFADSKAYFDEHFLEIENIDSVCKKLKVNKFFLTHLFKENIGIPPIKYLTEKRMELAKKLLSETTKSISLVSKDCGYVDVAYFCRIFKKTVGTTPLKYRRSER